MARSYLPDSTSGRELSTRARPADQIHLSTWEFPRDQQGDLHPSEFVRNDRRSWRDDELLASGALLDFQKLCDDAYPLSAGGGTPRELWCVLMKRRWMILTSVVLFTILAGVVSGVMRTKYDAVSRVAVYRQNSDPLNFNNDLGNSGDDFDYNVAVDTEVQVLESDLIAARVIYDQKLYKNEWFAPDIYQEFSRTGNEAQLTPEQMEKVLKHFRKSVKIDKIPKTRLIDINVLTPDATVSASVANSIARACIEQSYREKFQAAETIIGMDAPTAPRPGNQGGAIAAKAGALRDG